MGAFTADYLVGVESESGADEQNSAEWLREYLEFHDDFQTLPAGPARRFECLDYGSAESADGVPPRPYHSDAAWNAFRKNEELRRSHNITAEEMEMLSQVALMGNVQGPRDFLYILDTLREGKTPKKAAQQQRRSRGSKGDSN